MLHFPIQEGFWFDQSRGAVKGETLTLSNERAAFLFAFLALFIGLIGNRLWVILAYILHQLEAKAKFKRLFYHQNQTAIRNAGDPLQTVVDVFNIAWAWGLSAKWGLLHSVHLIVLGFCVWLATFALGLFSSRIVMGQADVSQSTVLIKPGTCGIMTNANVDTPRAVAAAMVWNQEKTSEAQTYARNCYSKGSWSSICEILPLSQIPYTVERNVACPVDQSQCAVSNSAIRMDTGYISSQMWGINSSPEDEMYYRSVATCAPVYPSQWETMSGAQLNKEAGLHMSDNDTFSVLKAGSVTIESITRPLTYYWNSHTPEDNVGYVVSAITSTIEWNPNTEYYRSDGDVTLFIINPNSITYLEQVDDPIFTAHQPDSGPGGTTLNIRYRPDYNLNTIACVEQAMICTPTQDCTRLASKFLNLADALTLPLNPWQNATTVRLVPAAALSTMASAAGRLGADALEANKKVLADALVSVGLPDNQWELEVQGWFNNTLAGLQIAIAQMAHQPPPFQPGGYVLNDNPILDQQCRNQKIKSTGPFLSFRVLELSLILGIGVLIIILSLCIETVGGAIQRLFRVDPQRRQQYRSDHYIELQRQGFESAGVRRWSGTRSRIPLPEDDVLVSKKSHSSLGSSTYTLLPKCELTEVGSGRWSQYEGYIGVPNPTY